MTEEIEELVKRIKIELVDGSSPILEYYETVKYKELNASNFVRVVINSKWVSYGLSHLNIMDLPCIDQVDESFLNDNFFIANTYRILEFESFNKD